MKDATHDAPPRLNTCHDFAWSRALWRTAAISIAIRLAAFLVGFLILAFVAADADWYHVTTTATTVGLDETTGATRRGLAILLLPLGPCIGAGLVALSKCVAKSQPKVSSHAGISQVSSSDTRATALSSRPLILSLIHHHP